MRLLRPTLAVLIVVVIAVAGIALTFRGATLATAQRSVTLPPRDIPPGLTVVPVINGALRSRAALAFRGGRFDDERDFTIGGLLIRHPDGMLLVDAGFGSDAAGHVATLPAMMRRATRHRLDESMGAALQRLGVSPAAIVLTHAHWDHVSGLEDLPDVPVLVPEAERAFIAAAGEKTELARRFAGDRVASYEFDDGPWLGFPASHDHFGDGSVVMVPTPGHTPGSITVFVSLPSGPVLALIGDTAWQLEGVERPAERPWLLRLMVDEDAARVRRHLVHLHELADAIPALVIVPAHDRRAWERVADIATTP